MGPNDAEVIRVFTRNPGTVISDTAFRVGQSIEIVVESEFGTAVSGQPSKLVVTVLDVSTSSVFTTFAPLAFGGGGTRSDPFLTGPIPVGNADHVWQVIAFLRMNDPSLTDVDASIVTSPYILITE